MLTRTNLNDLARRVASGDEQARGDFDRHVVPLVEIVVRRWLSQQPANGPSALSTTCHPDLPGHRTQAVAADKVRRISRAICARMIGQFLPGRRAPVGYADETLVIDGPWETIVATLAPAIG